MALTKAVYRIRVFELFPIVTVKVPAGGEICRG